MFWSNPAGRAVITEASDPTTARPRGFLARWWPVMPAAAGRLARSVQAAELSGAACAFWMRTLAVLVVAAWLAYSVAWPRDLYYLSIAATFFVLGYLPYRWRRHPHAEAIKLVFSCLDVMLVTTAILMPPPAGLSVDWPIQTRLRGQEFLYLLLLLAEAALTYSPLRVLWTGLAIALVWTVGVQFLYARPETTRFADLATDVPITMDTVLRTYLHPTFVGLTAWWTQVVVTMLFTAILALAVWRARRTLVAQVHAEVVHADLARYVSPDVADALASRAPSGFGEPVIRTVAVLFADMIGFTRHAAGLTPEQTFTLLRSFQQRCCRIVFRHGGTLDKFLGDGLMATFGGLADEPDAAARALACAFELQDEMARWNVRRLRAGAAAIELSIGLHHGPVVVGNLGAQRRLEFTVVGDVVNMASRLEEATRELAGHLLVSDACLQAAGGPPQGRRFDRTLELKPRGSRRTLLVHLATVTGVDS